MKYIKSYNESNDESLVKLVSSSEITEFMDNRLMINPNKLDIELYESFIKNLYNDHESYSIDVS